MRLASCVSSLVLIHLPQVFMRQSMKPCPLAKPGCALSRVGSRVAAQRNLGALYSARGSAPKQTSSSKLVRRLKALAQVRRFRGRTVPERGGISRRKCRASAGGMVWLELHEYAGGLSSSWMGTAEERVGAPAMICVARWARGSGRHPR